MNLKMNICRALAVLFCSVLSQAAMSAVITTSTSVATFDSNGSDLVSVAGLNQFDPSLGTLTGISFTVDIDSYSAELSLDSYDMGTGGVFQFADLFGQISLNIDDGAGGGLLFASEGFGGAIFNEVDSVAIVPVLLPSSQSDDATSQLQTAGLFNDFIGTGTLSSIELGIFTFIEGSLVFLDDGSIDFIEVPGSASLNSFSVGPSTVSINYTYLSAVPVPAAVWLFGSGLIGLVGVARRKK